MVLNLGCTLETPWKLQNTIDTQAPLSEIKLFEDVDQLPW